MLDPKAAQFLAMMAKPSPTKFEDSIETRRKTFADGVRLLTATFPVAHPPRYEDTECQTAYGAVPLRVYHPDHQEIWRPLVFYHGGGFVLGDIATYHPFVARLCQALGAVIIAVEYRPAPEARWPEPVEECYAATRWVSEHATLWGGQMGEVMVAGDSAGGNFAAVVSQLARQRQEFTIVAQVLLYPVTDMTTKTPSMEAFGEGYFLDQRDMEWFGLQYLTHLDDAQDPTASPARASNLQGLPPALIITGEYDPLRDQGEAYGQKLLDAGVPVTVRRYDGMIHGFMSIPLFDQSTQAMNHVRDFLKGIP